MDNELTNGTSHKKLIKTIVLFYSLMRSRIIMFFLIFFVLSGSFLVLSSLAQSETPLLSPAKQIEDGILPQDVRCNLNLDLIFKSADGSPACVNPSSVDFLRDRGWGHLLFISNPKIVDFSNNEINNLVAGEFSKLELKIQNGMNREYPFTLLWKVDDIEGNNSQDYVKDNWITGSMAPNFTATVRPVWQPCFPGNYSINIEIIDNIDNPIILSNQENTSISVIGEPVPKCHENRNSTLIID